MVSKKSFTLLVATRTTPFFVVVPIYFVHYCRLIINIIVFLATRLNLVAITETTPPIKYNRNGDPTLTSHTHTPRHLPPRHIPPATFTPQITPCDIYPPYNYPRILHLHFNFNFNSMLSILCVFKKFYVIFSLRDHFSFEIVLCSITR